MGKSKKPVLIVVISVIVVIAVVAAIMLIPKVASADKLTKQLNLGEKYLSELNYEQAVIAYTEAIAIDPKNPDAYIGLAEAYLAQGEYDDALDILEQAMEELDENEEIEELQERIEAAKNETDSSVEEPAEPTAISTPVPTEIPAPTATLAPTEVPAPTATLVPTEIPAPTATLAPTEVPEPTARPEPTAPPTPTPTSTPTPTPEPTEIPMVESTEASFEVKENEDGTVTITKYIDKVATIVIIPETIGGKKVTGIGKEAFKGYSNLVIDTVDIGGMTLGVKAFSGVQINNLIMSSEVNPYKITSNVYHNGASLSGAKVLHLEIKEGVQSIASYLFAACDWLTEVNLPDSVTSIGREAFGGCSNLTSINLDNVTYFDYEAFNECNNLVIDRLEIGGKTFSTQVFTGVTINTMILSSSDGIYSDSAGSFKLAKVGALEFGLGLDAIPNHVFKAGDWLTEAELPDTIRFIGEHAFHNCSNLTRVVLPEGLNEIGEYAFCKSGITEIILPESLTTMEDGAFNTCLNLTEISIPSGVTELQTSLFSGSKNLERVTVTDSVIKVRPYAFSNCDAVTIVAPEGSYMESYAIDREYSLETY